MLGPTKWHETTRKKPKTYQPKLLMIKTNLVSKDIFYSSHYF